MRVVGLDIHRSFAEAAMIDEGRVQQMGRIELVRERVIAFAKRLGKNAEVADQWRGAFWSRRLGLLLPHRDLSTLSLSASKPGADSRSL
jgi:hypothetical protein